MNVAEIITELRRLKVVPFLEGDQLKIAGETGNLTGALLEKIKASKIPLVKYLKDAGTSKETRFIGLHPLSADYPASAAQIRLWLISQFEKGGIAYNIQVNFYLKGKLDIVAMERSFSLSFGKHESLRTVFRQVDGQIRQVILADNLFKLEKENIAGLADVKKHLQIEQRRIANRQFDLEKGPLVFAKMVLLPDDETIFFISLAHLISDGWSAAVLIKEILHNYGCICRDAGYSPEPLQFQYKDYLYWHEQKLAARALEDREFWKNYIPADGEHLNLPYSFSRPSIQSFEGDKIKFYPGVSFYTEIQSFCKKYNTTAFNFFRATLTLFLSRISGNKNISIGVPVSNRPHKDLENQIGLYVNTIPLFTTVDPDLAFVDFLPAVSENSAKAFKHQQYPFDKIIEDLNVKPDRSRNPLFDVMMVFLDAHSAGEAADIANRLGMELKSLDAYFFQDDHCETASVSSQVDLSFIFGTETGNSFYIEISYCTKLFDEVRIRQFLEIYRYMIGQVLHDPLIIVADIEIVTPVERTVILKEFNNTGHAFRDDKTIQCLFEECVAEMPDAVAVINGQFQLSYRQLNEKANRLAAYLRAAFDIKPGNLVGIQLERSEWLIISILGVLKSGGAYVPVDPAYPRQRVDYIISDSQCKGIINEQELEKFLFNEHLYDSSNLHLVNKPGDLAYVIYTSGSTGKPKGCMLEHRGVINRLEWMWNELGYDKSDIILQKTTFTFDVSVWELLMPVCHGAKLVFCGKDDVISPERIMYLVALHHITCFHFVPSMFKPFLSAAFNNIDPGNNLKSLRRVILSGEALPVQLVKIWYEKISIPLYNLYGPTEAAIDVTFYPTSRLDTKIPIGKPIWNTQLYILNDNKLLQPAGVIGEIYIGGVGLARGYVNNPVLTAERFLLNPYKENDRIYRTGDSGRWLPDGNIEFIERKDDQVKVRGYRIELGEVQNVLQSCPGIEASIVAVKPGVDGENEISAFIVSKKKQVVSVLNQYLANQLPAFMLPSNYTQLESMPLTANGKIDKKYLLALGAGNMESGAEYISPDSTAEKKLVSIWQQVLARDNIGIKDNFFDLGGNSLKILKVVSLINQHFGINMPVVTAFQFPNIQALASHLESNNDTAGNESEAERNYSFNTMQETLYLLNHISDD